MNELTHLNARGEAFMVDVGDKDNTEREASASGKIFLSPESFRLIREGGIKKGDVLGTARIAGIMAAKKTPDLIPLCHILMLTKAELNFNMKEDECSIEAVALVKTVGKTGVEMEALHAVSTALLTIYDMAKAVDKGMRIGEIRLLRKSGGRSGIWENPECTDPEPSKVRDWLGRMEEHDDPLVRSGARMTEDYIRSLRDRITYLEDRNRLKERHLQRMKEEKKLSNEIMNT